MKKFIFIIFLLLNACGYQSVNKIDKSNYYISKYKFLGNQQVNKILKKNFERNKSNINSEKEFEIIATSNLVKSKKSKDRAGEATNLSLEIVVDLEIFQNGKKIKKITINENTNYNNNDNKFELKQFEKILINDLVNKIIYRIDLNLSSI